MSAVSRPCQTGTTARYLSAQDAAIRSDIGATLRTGSATCGGSSSEQLIGRTVPPKTRCCSCSSSSPDQDRTESLTGLTQTGMAPQEEAHQLLTTHEHGLKTCWLSMIAMGVRWRRWTEQPHCSRLGLRGPRGSNRFRNSLTGLMPTLGRGAIMARHKLLQYRDILHTTPRATPKLSPNRQLLRADDCPLARAWTTSRWVTAATAPLFTAKQDASCSKPTLSGTLHTLVPT